MMESPKIPQGLDHVLSVDPEIMHGDLCFKGTRVPLTILLDNLDEGMGIDEFLVHYPSVSREQAEQIVLWEGNQLRSAAGLQRVGP